MRWRIDSIVFDSKTLQLSMSSLESKITVHQTFAIRAWISCYYTCIMPIYSAISTSYGVPSAMQCITLTIRTAFPEALLPVTYSYPPPLTLIVKWTPDTAHAFINTRNGLGDPLEFVAAGISKKLNLSEYLLLLHASHTDGFLAAVDVVASDDWVFARTGRDVDFDLRVGPCEGWKSMPEESVHAGRATGPVAVVELEALAL